MTDWAFDEHTREFVGRPRETADPDVMPDRHLVACPFQLPNEDHGEPQPFVRRILGINMHWVSCRTCGGSTGKCDTADRAFAYWNASRVTSPVDLRALAEVIDRAADEVFDAAAGYDGDFDNDGTGAAEVKAEIRAILSRHFSSSDATAEVK